MSDKDIGKRAAEKMSVFAWGTMPTDIDSNQKIVNDITKPRNSPTYRSATCCPDKFLLFIKKYNQTNKLRLTTKLSKASIPTGKKTVTMGIACKR